MCCYELRFSIIITIVHEIYYKYVNGTKISKQPVCLCLSMLLSTIQRMFSTTLFIKSYHHRNRII